MPVHRPLEHNLAVLSELVELLNLITLSIYGWTPSNYRIEPSYIHLLSAAVVCCDALIRPTFQLAGVGWSVSTKRPTTISLATKLAGSIAIFSAARGQSSNGDLRARKAKWFLLLGRNACLLKSNRCQGCTPCSRQSARRQDWLVQKQTGSSR